MLVDTQRIVIEESPDVTGSAQPRRISVFLTEDLVDPKMDKTTTKKKISKRVLIN